MTWSRHAWVLSLLADVWDGGSDLLRAAVGAVASDDEEHRDAPLLQLGHDNPRVETWPQTKAA